jgi:hypothetical protein
MLRTIFRSRLLSRVAPHYNPTCQSVTSKLLNISHPACTGYFHTTVLHYNNCALTYECQKHDKHQTDAMYENDVRRTNSTPFKQPSPACVDISATSRFTVSPDVGVEALPSEQEEACVSLVESPEWRRFLRDFDVSPYLMKSGHINLFERMDHY